MKEELYRLANHIASAKGGLPQGWQDWASEIEMDIRKLANREAQPVQSLELAGWQFKSVNGVWLGLIDEHGKNQAVREGCEVRGVYAMADALNDRDAVREAHAEWSRSTFGNVGPIGPLKHLSKEALEAAAQPDDLSEWADMQFLLWDAQRRAGITDEQITQAMIEKLSVNKKREWPEPKDGEPRLHITAPPAPAVPSKATPGNIEILASGYSNGTFQLDDDEANLATEIWNACRAAMLAQPVSQRYTFNSQEIPDGWKLVPVEPTEDMIAAAMNCDDVEFNSDETFCVNFDNIYAAMLAAAPEGGNG